VLRSKHQIGSFDLRFAHDLGEQFSEIYIQADLATCEERDPKGLYKKARAGEIPDTTSRPLRTRVAGSNPPELYRQDGINHHQFQPANQHRCGQQPFRTVVQTCKIARRPDVIP